MSDQDKQPLAASASAQPEAETADAALQHIVDGFLHFHHEIFPQQEELFKKLATAQAPRDAAVAGGVPSPQARVGTVRAQRVSAINEASAALAPMSSFMRPPAGGGRALGWARAAPRGPPAARAARRPTMPESSPGTAPAISE